MLPPSQLFTRIEAGDDDAVDELAGVIGKMLVRPNPSSGIAKLRLLLSTVDVTTMGRIAWEKIGLLDSILEASQNEEDRRRARETRSLEGTTTDSIAAQLRRH